MYSIWLKFRNLQKGQIIITYYKDPARRKPGVINIKPGLLTRLCLKNKGAVYVDNILVGKPCGGAKGLCLLNLRR
jgi:hypothetical protein